MRTTADSMPFPCRGPGKLHDVCGSGNGPLPADSAAELCLTVSAADLRKTWFSIACQDVFYL